MGLLDKLTTQGSAFTAYDGNNPPVNPLATQQSKLHADGNTPGYSLNGAQANTVASQYNAYEDGITNPLPLPSQLDMNGTIPAVSPGGQGIPYLNNLPG
jgi:hypothetical protein